MLGSTHGPAGPLRNNWRGDHEVSQPGKASSLEWGVRWHMRETFLEAAARDAPWNGSWITGSAWRNGGRSLVQPPSKNRVGGEVMLGSENF